MKRKIPSTVALAVFESAARHESFARAAAEMCLTESAVSRQISNLESYLGIALFDRVKKQVVLTEAGRQYCESVSVNLSEIEMRTASLMSSRGEGGMLEVAVITTFGHRWLIPRLKGFIDSHPDVTVNLTEKAEPFDFKGTNFDMALHFDHSAWREVSITPLFGEEVVPVLNPEYFDLTKIRQPSDLAAHRLLYKRSRPEAWSHWFEIAGLINMQWKTSMRMELYSMVIEAARAGIGIGLVPRIYVLDEIRRGDLVIAFDIPLLHEKRYCLVFPDFRPKSRVTQKFSEWLLAESANATVPDLPGRIRR